MASGCIRSLGSQIGSVKIFDFRTPFQPRTISSYFSDSPTSTSNFLDGVMKKSIQEMQDFREVGLPLSSRIDIRDEDFGLYLMLLSVDCGQQMLFRDFFTPNLAPFKIKPFTKKTTRIINAFEEEFNTVKEVADYTIKKLIVLAYNMGCEALEDIPFLQSGHFELKSKTPAEIVQNPDCYLSYFLQKAKNNLSCWPIEQEWMGLSDEVIAFSKKCDASLTEQAQKLGITLRSDYTLPSRTYSEETADKTGHSFEDDGLVEQLPRR